MGTLLSAKKLVFIKSEGTKGTAETATLLPALAFDPVMEPTSPVIDRAGAGKFLGINTPSILGESTGTWNGGLELRGNGSNAMDDAISAILKACGFKNTSEVYTPCDPADAGTATIQQFNDGKKKVLYGCAGNFRLEGETGKRAMLTCDMQGCWGGESDEALGTWSPSAEAPLRFLAGTFTIATVARRISKFSLDMQNTVTPLYDINSTSGVKYYIITQRNPVMTIDPEDELVATYDWRGLWLAGTTAAVSLVLGTGAGKRITITIPKLQYREIKSGDRSGLAILDVTGQCLCNAGNDEVTITVTTA